MTATHALGVALSGGGSRAMAFHRGTLRAMHELGLVERVDVVSTVSGGSVFGAAWMCSIAKSESTDDFLAGLIPTLKSGFLWKAALSLRTLMVALPGYSRTDRLSEVFDALLDHRKLENLPERPSLCLNASVLNHGMPGRFTRSGFSCDGVGKRTGDHYPDHALKKRSLGFAVAASAAFPFALPPLTLWSDELAPFEGALASHTMLHLTDGGILENLGVERLLSEKSRFWSRNIIISDAGVAETAWAPSLVQRLLSFGAYALTTATLSRLLIVMNEKQNKTMRQLAMRRIGVIDESDQGRALWFVRIDQTWKTFFAGIPKPIVQRLLGGAPVPPNGSTDGYDAASPRADALEKGGVDLAKAREHYDAASAQHANAVGTNFTGLSDADIAALERHAMWQVHACRAVYGEILSETPQPQPAATGA